VSARERKGCNFGTKNPNENEGRKPSTLNNNTEDKASKSKWSQPRELSQKGKEKESRGYKKEL
jgi:hypothetical protein